MLSASSSTTKIDLCDGPMPRPHQYHCDVETSLNPCVFEQGDTGVAIGPWANSQTAGLGVLGCTSKGVSAGMVPKKAMADL
jgi:hypothetical protein